MEGYELVQPEEFDLWITALRSGQYTQTKGAFSRTRECGVSYCALAVFAKAVRKVEFDENDKFVNMLGAGTTVMNADFVEKIVDFNDEEELSFPEIADRLEENKQDYLTWCNAPS